MHTTLNFGFSTTPPQVTDLTVYDSVTTEFLGARFEFNIIGSSHYIQCPDLAYHEVFSCKTVDNTDVESLDLTGSFTREFTFENDHLAAETVIQTNPLDAFDPRQEYTLCYKFAEDAYTTIDLTDTGYETYHTYPEYDLALYSQTRFTDVDHGYPVAESSADSIKPV